MLTTDKTITTPEYWDGLLSGKRMNAKVDSSNGVRKTTFDRFKIVADLVEGPEVLEVAAGHARISELVKSKHKDWNVIACDQSEEAKNVSKFRPYYIIDAYDLSICADKENDTLICCQAFEYFEALNKVLREFQRVAKKGVFTFPNGEMSNWSQLYIFTPESVQELLMKYGKLVHFEVLEHLILAKIEFK